jgi:hypothetical protein
MMTYELDDVERALMSGVVERARADLDDGRPLTEMRRENFMSDEKESVMRRRRNRRNVEDKFVLFDDAAECAKAAAPVFEAQRRRWSMLHGFPKEHNILDTLLWLKEYAEERETDTAETGRLVFRKGRFGYERPASKSESEKAGE